MGEGETLADRVERADGASRKLDAEIENLLAGGSAADLAYVLTDIERTAAPPPYTGSLDAALMLVPAGWGWDVGDVHPPSEEYNDGGRPWCEIWIRNGYGRECLPGMNKTPSGRHHLNAATPALALTAAALRARARAEGE